MATRSCSRASAGVTRSHSLPNCSPRSRRSGSARRRRLKRPTASFQRCDVQTERQRRRACPVTIAKRDRRQRSRDQDEFDRRRPRRRHHAALTAAGLGSRSGGTRRHKGSAGRSAGRHFLLAHRGRRQSGYHANRLQREPDGCERRRRAQLTAANAVEGKLQIKAAAPVTGFVGRLSADRDVPGEPQ